MAYTDDQRLKMNNDDSVQFIALELIRPNPYQPRKTFEEERLNDLASSIQQHGILQPIVLRLFKVTILLWVSDDLEHLSWRD